MVSVVANYNNSGFMYNYKIITIMHYPHFSHISNINVRQVIFFK